MSNNRGRPPKHWAEKARIFAWYREVKRRGWKDYQLNKEFALNEEAKNRRDSCEPVRTFDTIRRSGRQPLRDRQGEYDHDLIQAVGRHPLFAGTQELYEAEIWDVFQEQTSTAEVLIERIDRLFKIHSLMRVDPLLTEELVERYVKTGPQNLFDWCLNISLRQVTYFDQIVLMWTLFQQANQVKNWEICDVLEAVMN